jgi:hypothetical protein
MDLSDFEKIRGIAFRARMMEKRDKRLDDFLREHGLAEPKSVEYSPLRGSETANCFRNVETHVKIAGGRNETGWAFYELVDVSIHTVAHAIWVRPTGRRMDITPWEHPPQRRILFLPDERVAIKRGYTAGVRSVYAQDERVRAMELFDTEFYRIVEDCIKPDGNHFDIPMSRFQGAADRCGLPWEVASKKVEHGMRNFGH